MQCSIYFFILHLLLQFSGSISEYDDKSIWEGNREFENVECPVCGNIIGRVFTDLIPEASLIKSSDKNYE